MEAEVRRPLWRGSQMVRALWFDRALLGEDEARRRLLGAWELGAHAYGVDDGYLLAWKAARRLGCETAPGLPLCDQEGVLASAPLLPDERAGIASGTAVLVRGASLHPHPLDAGTRIDPSSWLDLSALPVCVALAMPAAPDSGFANAVPEAAPDVRTLLGGAVPPASASRAAFLQNAARMSRRTAASGHGGISARPAISARGLMLVLAILAVLAAVTVLSLMSGSTPAGAKEESTLAGKAAVGVFLAALVLLFRSRSSGEAGGSVNAGQDASRHARQGTHPAPSPLGDWLAARAARLAAMTRIAGLLGWRQANYLRKMLRQFDEGNLDEALRHAIPLDGREAPGRQAFGVPGRRDSLDIGGGVSAAGIGLDAESIGLLRQTYQRSFDMLDRAGRIDEAVFVLAELMNRHQEAVDYLERKERIAQAAQLAETLALPPATAVRLYCKAGDLARAVLLARLSGCFLDAVGELERRRDAGAGALRLEWALDLAARGDLADAALAVWPLAEERMRALDWLREAEAGGGTLGVAGLLYTLALNPEALRTRKTAMQAVQALLTTPGPDAVRQRTRAAECLLRLDGHNAITRQLAAALWRVLAGERGAGLHALPDDKLAALLKVANDPVLVEDLPRMAWKAAPAPTPLASRADILQVRFAETGLYALEDVRALPDGGHLLALGEGGVVLAREGGRAPLRFPVPAHHLVVSHNGRRALALARRERAVRVSRIDLVSGKFEDWFSADLRFWAGEYDGATWSVVADERLMVLDATKPGRSVLWQVADLPGKIIGFEQQGEHQALLMGHRDSVEQWRYKLPERRLLAREQSQVPQSVFTVLPDCRNDQPVLLQVVEQRPNGDAPSLWILNDGHDDAGIPWPHGVAPRASLHEGLLLLRFADGDAWHCTVATRRGAIVAEIVLPEALEAGATLNGGHLLAWDRRGRVVDIDVHTAALRTLTFG